MLPSWGFILISRNELQTGLCFTLKPPIFFCPLSITPDWTVASSPSPPFQIPWPPSDFKPQKINGPLVESVKNHPLSAKNHNFSNIEPHRAFPLSKLESTSSFRGCKGRLSKRSSSHERDSSPFVDLLSNPDDDGGKNSSLDVDSFPYVCHGLCVCVFIVVTWR